MNTTSTRSQSAARSPQKQKSQQQWSVENLRRRLEDHVRANPLKAVGQAVAVGYVLRFLPLRAMLSTGLRLAAPLMLLNRVWQQANLSGGSNGREGSGQ
jgi:hypothetical protein